MTPPPPWPSPSSPSLLSPQHFTVPSAMCAQEKATPTASACTSGSATSIGVVLDWTASVPSSPETLSPQQKTPSRVSAHVCDRPAATADASDDSGTRSGDSDCGMSPCGPSWPAALLPQQSTSPSKV